MCLNANKKWNEEGFDDKSQIYGWGGGKDILWKGEDKYYRAARGFAMLYIGYGQI